MRAMTFARSLLSLLLALMMGLTSLSYAAARGQAPAADLVEICAGFGTQMIALDADGNPTDGAHICPDAVGAVAFADAPIPQAKIIRRADGEALQPLVQVGIIVETLRPTRARSPPFLL